MNRLVPSSRRETVWVGISALAGVLLLLLDQWSKHLLVSRFAMHESHPVIPGWFAITRVANKGAAFGILQNQRFLLLGIALAVAFGVFFCFRKLTEDFPERVLAVFFVLSGLFGNSIDRLWRGEVVDFLDVHYYNIYHYPTFNIADCAICTGVFLFILSTLLRKAPSEDC
ncbi:MAG: signal peptidase II [Victivallaceae bacterium]|nr:signal peptidase II [Victivallaceae bacterium]